MDNSVWIGSPPVEVLIRRSPRARRFSLRISNADGRVSLTVPKSAPMKEAVAFARRQESWLKKHLDTRPEEIIPEIGGNILFEGRQVLLCGGAGRTVHLTGDRLEVPGKPEQLGAKLRGFCKVRAREKLARASEGYAEKLGVSFGRITLRDTRSRWGSCTEAGNLMYSWRLILAPPEVLDYVAAHEVAHLLEMNHSKNYWDNVESICPGFKAHRAWLRQNGGQLHQIRL